jgi:hypothetical protein
MSEVPLYELFFGLSRRARLGGWGGTVPASGLAAYRGTSLIRNTPLLGFYSSPMPRVLGGS